MMFLSLLCLATSLIFHLACLWRASHSRPQGHFFLIKEKSFFGSPKAFQALLEAWVARHPHLSFVSKDRDHWIIQEKTRFFSYGLFFDFQMFESPSEKGSPAPNLLANTIRIGVEAKLIPMGEEAQWFADLAWSEKDRHVG